MSAEALIQQALSDHRTAAEAYEDAIAATYGPAGAESAVIYARSQYRHGQDAATRALRLLRSHQRAAHIMRRVVIDLLDADSQAGKPYLRDVISRARKAHSLLTDSPSGPPQKENE